MEPLYIDSIFIADCFLSALINDDYSGLSDDDQAKLEAWYDGYIESGVTYLFDPGAYEFETDVVTGLKANCCKVNVFET